MFKSMLKNAGKTKIEKHTIKPADLQHLMVDYEDALDQLPHILKVSIGLWRQHIPPMVVKAKKIDFCCFV